MSISIDAQRAQELFLAALEQPSADGRAAFLAAECGADNGLRQRVEALLRSHNEPGSFLDHPLAVGAAGFPRPNGEESGRFSLNNGSPTHERIGPYKLLQRLGEGGMGEVWMAEQEQPVRRRVAVKLIRPDLESRHVLARFEQERQALAMMDHPNIAKVLDAGTIPSPIRRQESGIRKQSDAGSPLTPDSCPLTPEAGRPYFVMELVKGIPITNYCDQEHLSPHERLELFIPVCQAIQHAHQKGIVHRDLKPSNVIIALYDGKPVPKVIDFGVAKAMQQKLVEHTIFTQVGQIVGTVEYMAPEQAELNNLDIDTRADIYSLGVLLYELLTGGPPFTKEQLCRSGYGEMLRIIREVEPARPSTRLSTSAELPTLAAKRKLEPKRLTQAIHGDLDWIAMKCLEKERGRRYETADGLANDLQRYLADEPVQACPPSAAYRLRKFARRNKRAVLAVTAIFLLLCAGITGTSWGLVRAENARQSEAEQRKLAEDAVVSERKAKEAEAEQRNRATQAAEKAKREAAVAAAINNFFNDDILKLSSPTGQVSRGVTPDANLKLRTVLQRAATRIDGKFPNEPEVEMRLRYTIGFALMSVGDNSGALPQFEKVAALSQKLLGRDDPYTLNAEYRVASAHRNLHHLDIALPMLEENVQRHLAILGEQKPQTFVAMSGLAMTYGVKGQWEKALELAGRTLELRKRHLPPNHTDTLVSMNNLASLYFQQKDVAKALPLFEETLAKMKTKLGPLHPERLNTTRNLAHAYHAAEQLDAAIPLQEMLVRQLKTAYGLDDSATQKGIDDLITYYVDAGRCDKAATLLASIESGGANRPAAVNQRQDQRERRHRQLIERARPAAEKYQAELAAKQADHPDTLAAREAFALVLRDLKRTGPAAYHLKAVLDDRQRLFPVDHADTQTCRLELGTARLQQKKYAEAEPLLLEAYAGLKHHETQFPESKSRVTEALERLVQLYDAWDKKDKAMEWRKKLDEQKKQ